MKCIILCGGFATRLMPLTKNKAKPLLEVSGKLIIDYVLEKVSGIKEIDKIIISTNEKFSADFKKWLPKDSRYKIVIEKTIKEEEKLGAVGGINFVVNKEKIKDDTMVIAGDNIFGFALQDFIKFYHDKKTVVMAAFDIKNKEKSKLYGIIRIDKNQKIIDFEEKPKDPKSTLASTACYIFPEKILPLFQEYLENNRSKDAPGFFLEWLRKKQEIHAYVFSNYWFDIGDFKSLEKAGKFLKSTQN
jgi:glucose-1-phosphate thymidylyltransferase